jgi:ribonuclease P protein component
MEPRPRYTLGRQERLKSRKRIGQLFAGGQSQGQFPLRALFLPVAEAEAPVLQCGFSVSTRHFKKAVQRNRVKRLLREAWRLQKQPLEDHLKATGQRLAVFLLYTTNELPQYTTVLEKTGQLIQRLIKKTNSGHEKLL